jgi:zinc protease
VLLKKQAEFPALLMNYHVPSVAHDDSFALDILEIILSRGRTSRLYRNLVYHQRIAHSAWASYHRVSIDPSTFTIGAQAMPGKDTATLEAAIDEAVAGVRSKGVTKAELNKAKSQVAANFIFAQESNHGQAMRIGLYELTVGWRQMNEYLQGIQAVTSEDVKKVANHYLTPDRRTVGVLEPRPSKGS